jgi:carboxylate-amine ligase
VFIRAFPRCGIPDAYGDFAGYADYAELLFATGSVTEATQIWWTIRPHHTYGTLEIRAADGQPDREDSLAVAALTVALVARLMERHDAGQTLPVHAARLLEENRWRALRYGLTGRLIDLERRVEVPAGEVVLRLLDELTGPAARLGVEAEFARVERLVVEGNSAQRQLALYEGGLDIAAIHGQLVRETMASADTQSVGAATQG